MADEQDMRKMGGLRKHMPVTAATMGVATLAIAGFPLLSGFWSKDEILAVAFEAGGFASVLYVIGLLTAMLTAFYMTRQWVMVFGGDSRWGEGVHPHESPRVMTAPLVVLAVLSVGAGLINTPFRLGLEHFLEPAFEGIALAHPPDGIGMFVLLAAISVGAGLVGIAMGGFVYSRPREVWERFQSGFGRVWDAWSSAYRVDDLYGAALVAPGRKLSEAAAFKFDLPIIDGLVNGVGRLFKETGIRTRVVQTGYVRSYGVAFIAGLLAAIVWLIMVGGA
jgi:NADH-quinone oxidoreductase subunit L